jgi:carbon monoxide dehydrogenase subunit G
LRAGFDLEPAPDGSTKVIWRGHSNVMGPIASLAGGMLEPLAKKNVQKLIDGLQKALS